MLDSRSKRFTFAHPPRYSLVLSSFYQQTIMPSILARMQFLEKCSQFRTSAADNALR
jgi:putative component of membrane protein insertase Oxa1/YidC/SpoIIIJ protein YidD